MTLRLHEDHANAQRLAEGLAQMPLIDIDLTTVQTNMVFFNIRKEAGVTAPQLAERLRDKHRIQIMDMGEYRFRAVLHYWISRENVDQALAAFQEELS